MRVLTYALVGVVTVTEFMPLQLTQSVSITVRREGACQNRHAVRSQYTAMLSEKGCRHDVVVTQPALSVSSSDRSRAAEPKLNQSFASQHGKRPFFKATQVEPLQSACMITLPPLLPLTARCVPCSIVLACEGAGMQPPHGGCAANVWHSSSGNG